MYSVGGLGSMSWFSVPKPAEPQSPKALNPEPPTC